MKKLIAVAAILSVMFLGAGTSQAVLGVPDAVPGEDILIPFFIVSMPGFGSDNSLITITDINGVGVPNVLHLRLFDVNSVEQYNEWIDMTPDEVYVGNALDIVNNMAPGAPAPAPPAGRRALEADLDFDGINDHWVGYIHFERNPLLAGGNDFISSVYQVSVADGMVAGYTGVSMEEVATAVALADPRLEAYSGAVGADFGGLEAFSAGSLLAAEQVLTTGAPGPAAWQFRLLPRVYVADDTANSTNLLILWTDVEVGLFPAIAPLHINYYDEDENALSSALIITDELNFLDVKDIYPLGLRNVAPLAYIAGWIDIRIPDFSAVPVPLVQDRMWLGYSLQRAALSSTTLDVILEAHRDAN